MLPRSSHTEATNIHQLISDFFTVREIFKHTFKGIGITRSISGNQDVVTKQYVELRVDRKRMILDVYPNSLHSQKTKEQSNEKHAKAKHKTDLEI